MASAIPQDGYVVPSLDPPPSQTPAELSEVLCQTFNFKPAVSTFSSNNLLGFIIPVA